ncbi:hypothetical protein [Agreia sp. Leaf283]|uniref:hypothetical protein n=1 Tax=Agreia sp. Leaf283 TaxID=1736321 RepID=UPI0006F6FC8E|nr:hypothetical protein [Agreia sp. Leaf283]KQP55816.1 hypothetical protein ASF51_11730 [Agreia sp. Leaf283]
MNKVGDFTALMAGIDFVPTDPYAILHIHKQIWCVAPHGKILGWIRWDEPKSHGRMFHVYSHGLDEGGKRAWVKSFETIGSAATFIRQHAAEMSALTARLLPDTDDLVDGKPQRMVDE